MDMVESFGYALYKTSDEMQSKCLRPLQDSFFARPHVFYKLGLGCWNSYGIIYLFILYVLVHDTSEIILQESGPKRLSIR